ncbi:hypothetical protein SAMN05660297_01097 [Natronincola peptidivorans]|uniref:4Fe-4S ferredoxin-type domain-containing protein n=1 Tax=Natronincola peptidivorans TaxID=426128 RepID=A0A1I0AX83_9FIRM|nr:EFR1 family ferrodoxin [Natronincola peptidivorans]SES98402.1 hypothetical protein SAMN05660297_01097 [Natronincola peptidivorans]
MKTTIYYFSGTGNSLAAAKKVSSRIKKSAIIPISKAFSQKEFIESSETVGFVFPMYYLGMPDIVIRFIKKLDMSKVAHIFTIITRGVDTPFAGGAMAQIEKELHDKGKRLDAGFYLTMGDNFILYWWDSTAEDVLMRRLSEMEPKLDRIIESIINRENTIEKNITDRLFPIAKHLPLLGSNYYLRNTYKQDKYFYSDDTCNGCGICEKVCSVKNIKLKAGKPQWLHNNCQQCLACLHFCPSTSLQFTKRFIQFGNDTRRMKRYRHPHISVKDMCLD